MKKSRELYDYVIEKKAIECGITKQEADILLFFYNNKNLDRAIDAVTYRGFSKSYVSKALALLLERGLVEIKSDNIDKRYQRIIILDKASNIVSCLKDTQKRYFDSIKKGISKEDFMVHIKVIDTMIENVKNMMKG